MVIFCLLGAPLISQFGVKPILVGGCVGYPIYAGALYYNSITQSDAFLIVGGLLCGISAGLFWASEGTIFTSYPSDAQRGKYLAYWSLCKNFGPMIGGMVNLGLNVHTRNGSSTNPKVFIVFTALMAFGCILTLLFPTKVFRHDGSQVMLQRSRGFFKEISNTLKVFLDLRVILLLPFFFFSYFYYAYQSNYLATYFNIRTRAFSSLLSPLGAIISSYLMGFYLDSQRWSERSKGLIMLVIVFIFQMGLWTWISILRSIYGDNASIGIDWTDGMHFNRTYPVAFFMNFVGQGTQNYLYWVVGHFAFSVNNVSSYVGVLRSIEALGQTVAWAITETSSTTSPVSIYINFIGLFISIIISIPVIMKLSYESKEKEEIDINENGSSTPTLSLEKELEANNNITTQK